MELIRVERNPNCRQWFQVTLGGCLFDEMTSRAKALRVATRIAQQRGEKFVVYEGFPLDIREGK